MGRFINSDSQINSSLGILGVNLFAYCLNSPCILIELGGNKPGDLFDTMDAAAIDFGNYIGQKSIDESREYASYIYSTFVSQTITVAVTETRWYNWYSWETTTYREIEVSTLKYSYNKPKRGRKSGVAIPLRWGKSIEHQAIIHTHGAYLEGYKNDSFSSADKKIASKKIALFIWSHHLVL